MKIILIVEDLSAEQLVAKKTVLSAGYKAIMADNLADAFRLWEKVPVAGILTDLHFPEKSGSIPGPCGLAIIVRAALNNIPVSVCSDIDHHHAEYLRSVVSDLEQIGKIKIPFTMDRKDWVHAWNNLQKTMEEGS